MAPNGVWRIFLYICIRRHLAQAILDRLVFFAGDNAGTMARPADSNATRTKHNDCADVLLIGVGLVLSLACLWMRWQYSLWLEDRYCVV